MHECLPERPENLEDGRRRCGGNGRKILHKLRDLCRHVPQRGDKDKMVKMDVKIIRSPNRKKTVSARICGNELLIRLPSGLSKSEETRWIEKMCQRMEKKTQKREPDSNALVKRAKELNRQYFNGLLKINSIKYVTNQNSVFGSCTTRQGTIRISHRVAKMPRWVKDYLIIHEMAHLVHPDHSKAFWGVVNRYRYTERARGYLIARGMEEDVSPGNS